MQSYCRYENVVHLIAWTCQTPLVSKHTCNQKYIVVDTNHSFQLLLCVEVTVTVHTQTSSRVLYWSTTRLLYYLISCKHICILIPILINSFTTCMRSLCQVIWHYTCTSSSAQPLQTYMYSIILRYKFNGVKRNTWDSQREKGLWKIELKWITIESL